MPGRRPRTPKEKRERTKRQEAACLYRTGNGQKANEKLKESQLLRFLRKLAGG